MYITSGWIKLTETESFKHGCLDDVTSCYGTHSFQANSVLELVDKLKAFTGHDDVLLDSCDEPGRIDIQGLENEHGYYAGASEIEAWKNGDKELWLVTYTFQVYKAEIVSLLGE